MSADIATLNERHSQPGFLVFKEGPGGFPIALITTPDATVAATPYGGQLLSCTFASDPRDLLFLSQKSVFSEGTAIRGGIPVCWPWFGPDPSNRGRSDHGFARTRMWEVAYTAITQDNECTLAFELTDTPQTLQIWPHPFRLLLRIHVGKTLTVELVTHNTGHEPFTLSQALHTYFSIGDISHTTLSGLEGIPYADKTDNGNVKSDPEILRFTGETDRIYRSAPALQLHDTNRNRIVSLISEGSGSTIVWNPWSDVCRQKSDFESDDYRRMVCIETANAGNDTITLPPQQSHTLKASYRLG